MKSFVVPGIVAIVLAVAGSAFWSIGKTEQRLADAHKALAMLQYAEAGAESDATVAEPPLMQRVVTASVPGGIGQAEQGDARRLRSTADYWQAQYAALEPKRDAGGAIVEKDPDSLLLAANASFRASQGETDRNTALRKMDAVVKTYTEALKNNSASVDAAYNFEYAVRQRDALAKPRAAAPKPAAAANAAAAAESDLPAGPTLHGHPGGPPAKTDMAQFKIVIPKRGEERKDDPQAGKGGTKIRKG